MPDIFCKIINGEIPATVEHRDEDFIVLHDINPQAPVHLLIIPLRHIQYFADCAADDCMLMGKALLLAEQMAKMNGLTNGYRLIVNQGPDGGQVVPHLHFHLLGGTHLGPKIVK